MSNLTLTIRETVGILMARVRLLHSIGKNEEAEAAYDANIDKFTLQEYVDWLNRPEEGVIKGELMEAECWAECDIKTARQLGAYLDACVEREIEKANYR